MTHASHLRLTPAEVKVLWEKGHYAPKGYLYQLILAHRKPGWVWRITNITEFCKEWGFARRTFYRAKASLIKEGVLEEEIFGAIELKIISTDMCVTSDTVVSGKAQPVPTEAHSAPDLAQPVPNGSHLSAEILSEQESCDSTPLKQLITTTTPSVCVSENQKSNVKNSKVRTTVDGNGRLMSQDENAGYPNKTTHLEQDIYAPLVLLQSKKKFDINLKDRQLRRAIERWPERIEVAIACLEEKELTVKHPTRFLQKAIEEQWQPEEQAKEKAPEEFREWFKEARQRGLVVGSQRVDGQIMVYTVDERCVPFNELRQLSWEALTSQPMAEDGPPVNTNPPEQPSALDSESDPPVVLHRVNNANSQREGSVNATQTPMSRELEAVAERCQVDIPMLQAAWELVAGSLGASDCRAVSSGVTR